ncbi:restriction endonuclease subunit S [Enterobacter hormaechei]|uniref:restriction endonuclease subunit S n=1 Tax=Enterobacter hormaechei TaxID=158836 RepID=UPI00125223E7|nr:restriction endonuclease subunit S [Enterobacter hormaechei]VAG70108.1 restriction modification system DNA specificity domain-containing protein [Enterobacter hormaechei]
MAKYKAYPEYKDSGVEWLGEVPNHWKTVSISRLFSRIKRTGYTEKELLSVYRDYGVIPKSSRDDNNNKPSEDLSPYQLVEPNDLVMNKMKAWQGSIAISEYEGIVSPAYFVYKPNNVLFELAYPRYVHYLLRNPIYVTQYLSRSKGIRVNQWDLDPDEFRNIELLLPDKTEQEKIYSFLDHETAKIDNLIEKQQQLIELLKEKRQAVISHAVTKGLNPDVPMKDSGVEWLGEVPDHWELVPLKYLCNFSGGGTPTKDNLSYWQGGTVPWVSPKDMKSFWISETQDYVTPKAVSESSTNYIEEGSLLMVVRSGILQRNIPVAINIVKVTMNQDMKALRFNERMKAHYAAYFINGNINSLLLEWTKEGTTVESIEHEYLANGLIPVPPIDEQHSIIKSISGQMIRFELLEEKALTGIRLLQERRTALISAAVTGKIDVRDWVAPDTQDLEEPQEAIA